MAEKNIMATGRRKNAIAVAKLTKGKGTKKMGSFEKPPIII